MQPVNIRIFTTFEDAETLWREAEKIADLHVYQTYDWLTGWYRLVGEASGVEPCLVAVSDTDQRLLTILPLAIEQHGLWRRLIWMGAEFFDYHAPILMPNAADKVRNIGSEVIWHALRKELPGVDYADFERQPAPIGKQTNPFVNHAAVPCTQSAHHTDLFDDWPTYYAGKRGKRTRHNDRRKRKKLEKLGKLSFVVARSRDEIDRLLAAMLEQKKAFTEAIGERNLLERPGYKDLLAHLAEQGLKDGSVLLCATDLDGEILAAQWGAVHHRRLYSMIASYEHGAHAKLSPGDVLLHDLLSWCFDNNIETYDFTFGDEPYKMSWCEHHVPLYRSLMPITAWGAVRAYPLRWLLRLKRWAKSKQWLATTYARTRKLVHGVV